MSHPVIQVENLGKKYVIGHQTQERYTALRDVIANGVKSIGRRLLRPEQRKTAHPAYEEFWALKDISFEVKQGEVVGIIGRNGAGKSTLLKILSRITEPTTGRIRIKGRVASLLEVGTGFHPELTGRENIFLNGAILGMSRVEINRKFDEMVAFAEVERFLDTPVKRYSSGMYVRLAFAVAAHLEPEILVVDEVLAVGDARFQRKCLGKMKAVGSEGRTVLFVSHNMPTITSLCQKCILLDAGEIAQMGATSDVVTSYYSSGESSPAFVDYSKRQKPVGDIYAQLISGAVVDQQGKVAVEIPITQPFTVCMKYRILQKTPIEFVPNFHFYTADGNCAFITSTKSIESNCPGEYLAECQVPDNLLNSEPYFVSLALSSFEPQLQIHFWEMSALMFTVTDPIEGVITRNGFKGQVPGAVRPLLKWQVEKVS